MDKLLKLFFLEAVNLLKRLLMLKIIKLYIFQIYDKINCFISFLIVSH